MQPLVAVVKKWVLHSQRACFCSLRYPVCNAHAPFYHLCYVPLYNIFPLFSKTVRFLKKKYWTQNLCFDFLYNFCLKHFSFWEEMSELGSKMYIALMSSAFYSCPILMKLQFLRHIFEKSSNIKFHENLFSGNRDVPCGLTAEQTWRSYSQFCENT